MPRDTHLLFTDDTLLASWGEDLQLVLDWFAAECEVDGMRFKEALILSWEWVETAS